MKIFLALQKLKTMANKINAIDEMAIITGTTNFARNTVVNTLFNRSTLTKKGVDKISRITGLDSKDIRGLHLAFSNPKGYLLTNTVKKIDEVQSFRKAINAIRQGDIDYANNFFKTMVGNATSLDEPIVSTIRNIISEKFGISPQLLSQVDSLNINRPRRNIDNSYISWDKDGNMVRKVRGKIIKPFDLTTLKQGRMPTKAQKRKIIRDIEDGILTIEDVYSIVMPDIFTDYDELNIGDNSEFNTPYRHSDFMNTVDELGIDDTINIKPNDTIDDIISRVLQNESENIHGSYANSNTVSIEDALNRLSNNFNHFLDNANNTVTKNYSFVRDSIFDSNNNYSYNQAFAIEDLVDVTVLDDIQADSGSASGDLLIFIGERGIWLTTTTDELEQYYQQTIQSLNLILQGE
jgi:hypothetical protein